MWLEFSLIGSSVIALADHLERYDNGPLEIIRVNGNVACDGCVDAWTKALLKNMSLLELELCRNAFSKEGVAALQKAAESGETCLLHTEGCSTERKSKQNVDTPHNDILGADLTPGKSVDPERIGGDVAVQKYRA